MKKVGGFVFFFLLNLHFISFHSLLCFSSLWVKVWCNCYPGSSEGKVYSFQDFCLLLQFEYMSRCRYFKFILLGILWAFWICGLVFVINFGNFSAIITCSSVPFSLLLVFPLHAYYTFCKCSTVLWYFVLCFHSFSYCILVLEVSIPYLEAHWFFSLLCLVLQMHLHFWYQLFNS